MQLWATLLFVGLLCSELGCSPKADLAKADRALEQFRMHQAAEAYNSIYSEASEEFRANATKDSFVAFMTAIRKKLGSLRTAQRTNGNVDFQSWGAYVTLLYESGYSEGHATERFVFRVRGEDVRLMTYSIDSTELITR